MSDNFLLWFWTWCLVFDLVKILMGMMRYVFLYFVVREKKK